MQTSVQKMTAACREMLIPQRKDKKQMLRDAGITLVMAVVSLLGVTGRYSF